MALNVGNAEYFYIRIENSRERAYELLAQLASEEVSLLAFSAEPFGPNMLALPICAVGLGRLYRLPLS
jgi:hypothetical protein